MSIRSAPDPSTQRQQRRLTQAANQLALGLVFASLVLAGYAVAGVSLLAMLWVQLRH